MNKKVLWLTGILALQFVVAVGLFIGSRSASSDFNSHPLLNFDRTQVDKIVVGDGKSQLIVSSNSGVWQLPEQNNLPANAAKLNTVLDKLGNLRATWPIATSAGSHARFDVSPDKFQRRVQLFKGDQLLDELFIGTSPGFKKVHAREGTDNEVYAVALNAYDFPVKGADWLDKSLLASEDIRSVSGKDFKLLKTDGGWSLQSLSIGDDSASSSQPNADTVKTLLTALDTLSVSKVAQVPPEFLQDGLIQLNVSGAQNWKYEFMEKDKQFFVRRDDVDAVFTLSKHDYQEIANISMDNLRKPAPVANSEGNPD